jgi:polyribonucleotide nucleotidyltransferase
MTISTGKYARLADGCTVTNIGDTSVMVTTVSKSSSTSISFLPLIVDYKQKAAAAGRIPTNFLRREMGYNEHEVLTSRIIDRSVRPLFPEKFRCETQIMCNMLAIDGKNDSDILAINGASAALAVSDIPWNGPIGAVRVGFIDNEIMINPTRLEQKESILNLIVTAASKNLVVMIDGRADNIMMQDLRKALKVGVKECQNIILAIEKLQKKHSKQKRTIEPVTEIPKEIIETVKFTSEMKLRKIFTDFQLDKLSRDQAINDLRNEIILNVKTNHNYTEITVIGEIFSKFTKEVFRSLIFETNCRYVLIIPHL